MNSDRIFLALTSFGVFFVLNLGMWLMWVGH
jgi:hypothetical protein